MAEWLAGRVQDFTEGRRKIFVVGGNEVVLMRVTGTFYAYENRCLHMGGPVGEGMIIGKDFEPCFEPHAKHFTCYGGIVLNPRRERKAIELTPVIEKTHRLGSNNVQIEREQLRCWSYFT